MKISTIPVLAALLMFSMPAAAELSVTLTAPALEPGMESLEALLETAALGFQDDIKTMATTMTAKPLFISAFSSAAGTASLAFPFGTEGDYGLVIQAGSAGAVHASPLSPLILDRLSSLEPADDVKAGACVQPLSVRIAIPLAQILSGLSAGITAGGMYSPGETFSVSAFNFGAFSSWQSESAGYGFLSWEGIGVEAGAAYSGTRLGTTITPGTITQTVPLDPDGPGPLAAIQATMTVDPSINAGIDTSMFSANLQAATAGTAFGFITLSAGLGAMVSGGVSSLFLSTSEPITVMGYLSSLVETNGNISITGTASETWFLSVSPFLRTGLGFRFGPFSISIPIIWNIPEGAGAGIFAGISL